MSVHTRKLPATIKPMLGRLARESFDSPKHIFELKWDGMRALAFIVPLKRLGTVLAK